LAALVLRVEPYQGDAFTHEVTGDSIVFGRSSKADLVVPDRYMSRLQARLERAGDHWLIEDLGGRNPTLLNGRPITQPSRVVAGDLITVSDTRLRVEGTGTGSAADRRQEKTDVGKTLFRPAQALLAASEVQEREETEEALRHHTQRLRRLNEFHRALAAPITMEGLFDLVLDRAFADLSPEEAVIFLRGGDGVLRRVAQRRLPGVAGDFLYSQSLAREVTEKQLAALVEDTTADERFKEAQSIVLSGVRSLAAAPLLDGEGCPGLIVISSRVQVHSFTEPDLEELVFLAAAAAMRMRSIALAEEAAKRKVLEKELAIARQIQMALLPSELPALPGFELYASNIPTRAVSGDLYQVAMRREDKECVLLLADVAGKGISASLLTASLEALAAGPIEVGLPPDDICNRLSRRLYARTSAERYATGFVGVLHTDSGRFCWTNAGHNPALLLRASGEHEELGATGLPLGLLPVGEYERRDLSLAPGDLVVIYTDGVTEAANPQGEEYGLERLVALCRRHAGSGAPVLAASLQADLDAFACGVPFGDDRTFILLRRLP
jgi:serine phosphatase RsbU (regulator of sigma subunit)